MCGLKGVKIIFIDYLANRLKYRNILSKVVQTLSRKEVFFSIFFFFFFSGDKMLNLEEKRVLGEKKMF